MNSSSSVRLYRLLPALLSLLAVTPAPADDVTPWYQVDVVVFAHADTSDQEVWVDDPGTPNMAKAVVLAPSSASPGLGQTLNALFGDTDQDQALADFIDADGGTDDTAPVAFRLLPDDAQQLNAVVARLNGAADYRVLYHAAWRQPGYSPDKSIPVRIHVDPYGTQSAMLAAWDQAAAQAGDGQPAGAANAAAVSAQDEPSGGSDDNPPAQIWRINGIIAVTQSRYVHMDVDLLYQVQTPADTASEAADLAVTDPDASVTHTYRMKQSRRILNSGLYYFDHPEFGVLAKVTPYQPPKAVSPPPPAPPQQPS